MITSNILRVYNAELVRRQAELFELDQQRERKRAELAQVEHIIASLRRVEQAEEKMTPELEAQRQAAIDEAVTKAKAEAAADLEAAKTSAYEQGKLDTIAANEQAAKGAAERKRQARKRHKTQPA